MVIIFGGVSELIRIVHPNIGKNLLLAFFMGGVLISVKVLALYLSFGAFLNGQFLQVFLSAFYAFVERLFTLFRENKLDGHGLLNRKIVLNRIDKVVFKTVLYG